MTAIRTAIAAHPVGAYIAIAFAFSTPWSRPWSSWLRVAVASIAR